MPKVALLSRVKAKAGQGEELIAAFRPVFELVEQEPGTLLTSCTGPGTIPTCSGSASSTPMTMRSPPTAQAARWPRPRPRSPNSSPKQRGGGHDQVGASGHIRQEGQPGDQVAVGYQGH